MEHAMRNIGLATAVATSIAGTAMATAAEIKLMHAGAFTQVLLAIVPEFQKQTGHHVVFHRDTVGAMTKRIEGGERFDVTVLTPAAIDSLSAKGKVAPESRTNLARVGIGVVVKDGAPRRDIATVDAFKNALLTAKSVAYIDPAAGGSSGIYLAGLFEKLGIAEAIKPKAVLIHGGAVAEHVAKGDAEIGIHQISEILPVQGVILVGPLPKEIQNYTTYAAGLGANTKESEAGRALIKALSGPAAAEVLKSKGLEPAGS
jgi:molybdate transport system substrate-binding protein